MSNAVFRLPHFFIALMSLLVLLPACGPSEEVLVAKHGAVRDMMIHLARAEGNPDAVAEMFVDGAMPSQEWLQQISEKLIEIGDINFSGDQATVTFTIETFTGEIEARGEWKFVQKDGEWLISEAPIPAE